MANQNFPPRQSTQYATSSKQSHPQATSHQPPTTTYPSNRFDTIVIGVGGMGSATCYQLARRGQRVLGLERFDIPHDRGSSHGYTRIIRLPYYEDSSYVMLLLRAYELWRDIERRYGQHHASEQLLHLHGSIDAGPAESWVFKGALQSAIEFDLPHEVLTGLELAQRFPGYGLPQDQLALYQPQGGFLVPERCIVAFAFEAMRLGAQIHGREAVLGWEPLGNHEGVRVHTERAVYEADSLVISAGSWNDQMLGFLQGLAVPERQVLAWFQPERPELFQPDNFPVFNLLVDEGRFYGFPIHGVPGFKIGKYHHFEEHGRPDELDRELTWADEQVLRDATAKYFPQAAGATMSLSTCLFTNSPDGHFLIDLHPEYPQVSYASACTGHGYKFASVIGEILADLAQRRQSRHAIDLFTANRFTSSHTGASRTGDFGPGVADSNAIRHARNERQRTHKPHVGYGAGMPGQQGRQQSQQNGYRPAFKPSEVRSREQDWSVRSPW